MRDPPVEWGYRTPDDQLFLSPCIERRLKGHRIERCVGFSQRQSSCWSLAPAIRSRRQIRQKRGAPAVLGSEVPHPILDDMEPLVAGELEIRRAEARCSTREERRSSRSSSGEALGADGPAVSGAQVARGGRGLLSGGTDPRPRVSRLVLLSRCSGSPSRRSRGGGCGLPTGSRSAVLRTSRP